jgi:DNA polymerase-3 subunit alpha
MKGDLSGANEAITWYKSIFEEDFYLEVMRHPAKDPKQRSEVYDKQVSVNTELVKLAIQHEVKLIATNDIHFVNEEDADAHDLLICLNTGKDLDDPTRMRYTKEEWFKSTAEMNQLFADMPEVLTNTQEIVDKVESYELNAKPIMPAFPIPESFGTEAKYREIFTEEQLQEEFGEDYTRMGGYESTLRVKFEADYLKSLVEKGAIRRYGENIDSEIKERISFELHVIKTMGFPGYFLIVQDFINAARRMGVIVGPV